MTRPDYTSVEYYTCIDGMVGGPYSVEGLESLAYLQKVTPDTYIAYEGAEAFLPIRDTTLGPILFPWAGPTGPTAPEHWAPPGQENDPAFTQRRRFKMGEAKFDKVNGAPGQPDKVTVTGLLDEIREKEIDAGYDRPPSLRFRISRRSVDFWLMMIGGNALLLGGGILLDNPISLVFGIGGSGLFSFGLIWSMYGVMDRY